MPPVGFEPTILASERQKTHDLDRTATGIGCIFFLLGLNPVIDEDLTVQGQVSDLYTATVEVTRVCGCFYTW
jgi:hypothetical protein